MMTLPIRRWRLPCLILLTSLCMGCNLISLPYFLMFGCDSKNPPALLKLAEKDEEIKVVLLVANGIETRPEFVRADRELTNLLTRQLEESFRENKEDVKIVSSRQVEKYKEAHPNWATSDLKDIGDHFEADYVVYCEIENMSLYEKGSANQLFRGRAAISVDVYSMDGEDSEPRRKQYVCEYPRHGPTSVDEGNAQDFRQKFLNHIAKHLSWYFTSHPVSDEFAEGT